MSKLPDIVVISNDAGASEYLAYMVLKEFKIANWVLFALKNSPATKIFEKLNLDYKTLNNVEELKEIKKCDLIIYGTGWQVDFSMVARYLSQKFSIKSMALIDHWVNYKERFFDGIFPSYIITMDSVAYDLANDIFAHTSEVLRLKNYFLENIKISFDAIKEKSFDSVVFISEPTSVIAEKNFGSKNAYGFTEYSVLKDLIVNFNKILVRLHPSDEITKYDSIIKNHPNKDIKIINPYEETLVETLSKSALTIGFDGMAVFISYILGIKTLSYMPNSTRELTIPIPKKYLIKNLSDIDNIEFETKEIDFLDNGVSFFEVVTKVLEGK